MHAGLELCPTVPGRFEGTVRAVPLRPAGQQGFAVSDRIARDAYRRAVELEVDLRREGISPDSPLEDQKVSTDSPVFEAIESDRAKGFEVSADRLTNPQVELGVAFDALRELLEVRVFAHLRNLSARTDLGDALVLHMPI